MNEEKLRKYFLEGMSDPLVKPFYRKMLEWRANNGFAWQELIMMLKRAENGEFKD